MNSPWARTSALLLVLCASVVLCRGADTLPPSIQELFPAPDAVLRTVTQIKVSFVEPVTGVDASDLQINGTPAQSVTGSGHGPYLFIVGQPSPGAVQCRWVADHGIKDIADPPNSFAGGTWNYVLDSSVDVRSLVINEFMAE